MDFFWKASHFKGLGKFRKADFVALDAEFSPPKIADMIRRGIDPVEEALRRVIILSGADKRADPEALLKRWLRVETLLNARLCLACALAGPERCAALFAPFLNQTLTTSRLYIARINGCIDGRRTDGAFGQPDLLVVGDKELVMVEMKVRGNKSDHKYGEKQLLKYLTLAAYAFDYFGLDEVCHLILVPKEGPTPFQHKNSWIQSIDLITGMVHLRLDGLMKAAEGTNWRRLLQMSDGDSTLAHLVRDVPVKQIFYSSLLQSDSSPADPWISEARRQLDRLARDAEPD